MSQISLYFAAEPWRWWSPSGYWEAPFQCSRQASWQQTLHMRCPCPQTADCSAVGQLAVNSWCWGHKLVKVQGNREEGFRVLSYRMLPVGQRGPLWAWNSRAKHQFQLLLCPKSSQLSLTAISIKQQQLWPCVSLGLNKFVANWTQLLINCILISQSIQDKCSWIREHASPALFFSRMF